MTRLIIYSLAGIIIISSLVYSNYLAGRLAEKEAEGVRLFSEALDFVANFKLEDSTAVYGALDFIQQKLVLPNYSDSVKNSLVPLILVGEEGEIISSSNLPRSKSKDMEEAQLKLQAYLLSFRELHEPIKVEFAAGRFQQVYYGESYLLKQLRWFPIAQLLVAFVFIGVVFTGFAIAKRNEQNRVWVGLAKETAHQLGTPVSSLMAWIELLKLRTEDRSEDLELVQEMERDILRLENIAERFSKIGSKPELIAENLSEILDRSATYIKKRMTRTGSIKLIVENELPPNSTLKVNPQLFDWVIENLLKNALDAMQSKEGRITMLAGEKGANYYIEITDTGKGIPKSHFKKVFEPGFTTKKRGWGLGLSLTKRIVENYHKGKIFVKASELGKGTTFRILLPKHAA